MYSPTIIGNIFANLQAINKQALVLLGGSYLTGEATKDSDLDFYFIDSVINLLKLKTKIIKITKDFPDVKLNVMLVPWFFYKRGWYYVYGQSLDEKIHSSPINKPLIIRNCLKLAYLHYFKALAANSNYELDKSARELSLILLLVNNITPNPLRSKKSLLTEISKINSDQTVKLKNILTDTQDFKINSVAVLQCCSVVLSLTKPYLRFNFSNYIIYNLFFLRHLNPLFLLSNPDIMVLNKIKKYLELNVEPANILKVINKVVFPVIIINKG